VIEAYGLTNPDFRRPEQKGIPYPTTILVDKQGVVRFVNVWINYKERTTPETILEELKKLP
jgi:peroxiredoxin